MATISQKTTEGISRRSFIKSLTAAGVVTTGSPLLNIFVPKAYGDPGGDTPVTNGMNLIIFITDQERAIQWFPPGWAETNLPNFTELQNSGVNFTRAYTNTCMCTPARNCIFTGKFPAQHRSFDTLTEGFEQSKREHQLDPNLPNLATVLKSAGYEVVYKGKWHLTTAAIGADGERHHDDISRYGFDQWTPPDAGQDVEIENFGGGTADNDTAYIQEAIAYLEAKRDNPGNKPFCLVVSLVNPHDVLAFPKTYEDGGYDDSWTEGDIELPPTVDEQLLLNLKPTAQAALNVLTNGMGALNTPELKEQYLNFYANLMKRVDGQLGQLLGVFEGGSGTAGSDLRSNSLIVRMSDHGEMGMTHGGLRQKAFTCYEEVTRLPLIWSNPDLFPGGRNCDELVSHVDFLPTVCSLLGVPNWGSYGFRGIDYSSLILDENAGAVQDYILFTFDDVYAGQDAAGTTYGEGIVPQPNRIQMVVNKEFKYNRYYDYKGMETDQEEFYDLRPSSAGNVDTYDSHHPDYVPNKYNNSGAPLEMRNLSEWAEDQREEHPVLMGPKLGLTPEQEAGRTQMMNLLAAATDPINGRLTVTDPVVAPVAAQNVDIRTIKVDDTDMIQIKFLSSWGTDYQLQQSSGLDVWTDVGEPIPGNNGPILIQQPLESEAMFYRIYSTVIEE